LCLQKRAIRVKHFDGKEMLTVSSKKEHYKTHWNKLGSFKLSGQIFFATGKNAEPSRVKFRDWQSSDRLTSQKHNFHFFLLGFQEKSHDGFVLNFRVKCTEKGKNAEPSQAKFRVWQSYKVKNKFFIFSSWVPGKTPWWLCT